MLDEVIVAVFVLGYVVDTVFILVDVVVFVLDDVV